MSPEQAEAAQDHLASLRRSQGLGHQVADIAALTRIAELIRPYWTQLQTERIENKKKGQPEG